MARDAFEVERLRTGAPQRGEQPALARARQTADDDEAEPQRQLRELDVVEHRVIRRRGDVIRGELGGAAHVDAVGISGKRVDADATHAGMRRVHFVFPGVPSRGRNSRQTLSSSLGCAAAVGWTRSGWNSALLSAKPANMNGTSTILRALATSANVASKRCTYAGP